MKIESTSPFARAAGPRRTSRTSGGRSFASHLDGLGTTQEAAAPSALDSAYSLLAAQEMTPEQVAQRRGGSILDRMDELRHGLLTGGISRGSLERLAAEVEAERADVSDPRLAAVLDEIDLRAKVELAKFTR